MPTIKTKKNSSPAKTVKVEVKPEVKTKGVKLKLWSEIEKLGEIGDKHVRVVQGYKGPMLDVRQHIETDTYQGYTKRGITISLEEAKLLCGIIGKKLTPPVVK